MSDEIGTYSFLPYLRTGLANDVTTPTEPDARRGKLTVTLSVAGTGLTNPTPQPVDTPIELYGPGDIIGIDSKAIVKTEPHNWITNFEPNYLPYIDFYDEDYPWRYTPMAAASERLIPWITLLVLSEDEFDDGKNIMNRPLNYLKLKDSIETASVFPAEADMWAWAHVHINKNVAGSGDDPVNTDSNSVVSAFKSVLNENPDYAYARLLSPRKLGADKAYHTFVIPTFESGRLAGLGHDPAAVTGYGVDTIAWADYSGRQETKSFPYYHRWYFRTGSVGDFEFLVRLLQPRVADARVGRRDFDVQEPGSNIDGIDDPRLHGILRLGGALQVPVECLDSTEYADYQNYDKWYDSYPHPFQKQLAAFINLADDYTDKTTAQAHADSGLSIEDDTPEDPDPLITPPLYGRWHAMTSRLLKDRHGVQVPNNANWVHDLNLDPRWRTSANFGTMVIQDNQETYMDAAWGQVGDVMEANRRMHWAWLARFAAKMWYQKNFQPKPGVALEKYLRLTMPVQKRIISNGRTVYHTVTQSMVPSALLSAPMRRIQRPRGRIMSQLKFTSTIRADNLVTRVNQGDVTPAPERKVPDELLTHDDLIKQVKPTSLPGGLIELLSNHPNLKYLPLLLAVLLIVYFLVSGVLAGSALWVAIVAIVAAAIAAYIAMQKVVNKLQTAASIAPAQQTPDTVASILSSPDFHVTDFGDPFVAHSGAVDSVEAVRFKTALRSNYDFVQRSRDAGQPPVYTPLDFQASVDAMVAGINPAVTIPRYVFGQVSIPARIVDALDQEKFVAAMAYPEINLPMYKPLLELSHEDFVPNLNLIEPNSITLLETNQRFIESYMVGLNHEFARELLWREYPTDQRGSYFRQFWDVSSYQNKQKLDPKALRELLYDIPPLHQWKLTSNLGEHDLGNINGSKREEVVLVIRGELLKKYPTAVIYAQHAKWATDSEGNRVLSEPRVFDTGPEADVIKTPLYEAKVDPDIYFFGFDLAIPEAKGGSGEQPGDDAGWFFVVKERPGEPRFGLDVPGDASDMSVTSLPSWNDLAWSHVVADVESGKYLDISGTRNINVTNPGTPASDEEQQKKEDSYVHWRSSMNAAELAYILYQVPVLIGVHASEMLPDKCNNVVSG